MGRHRVTSDPAESTSSGTWASELDHGAMEEVLFLLKSHISLSMLWFTGPEHFFTSSNMFKLLNLLLLLCVFDPGETASKLVPAQTGQNVTLTCGAEAREIVYSDLSRLKRILPCQNEECESEHGRVFREGACDVIIQDLRLRDAGKYFLRVYYDDGQGEVKQQILEYKLCIQDEISVKKGEELKLDVLLPSADKVEHLAKRSTGPKEVWTRGQGVRSDRMAITDGNLIIHQFTRTDAGTYEVLDSDGEILIMVTVKESVDELSYYDDQTYYTLPQIPADVENAVIAILSVLLMALMILAAVQLNRILSYPRARLHIC
ncbi:uncharacterized protein [Pseudorasbora parva]|uniref:uncharacterized protein n=1 Tax=Pseudorasbora parva TaxID=51549 RepID=UPI00351ECB85